LSRNGAYLTFNRFKQKTGDNRASQYYVMKNPLASAALLANCTAETGEGVGKKNGYDEAIDCRSLLMNPTSTEDWDFDHQKCPNYRCCGTQGVDCATCTAIGATNEDDALGLACADQADSVDGFTARNWVTFFNIGQSTYLAFASARIMDQLQRDIDIYKIGVDGNGAFRPDGEPLTRIGVASSTNSMLNKNYTLVVSPYRKGFEASDDPCRPSTKVLNALP
jgi:hypothetical protein